MKFVPLYQHQEDEILEMSQMATAIVKEHFDPLIGPEMNDYMISLFQTPDAIRSQLEHGFRYYFVREDESKTNLGFLAFYPRGTAMYLSKFYLYKENRGKGYSRAMLNFVKEQARKEGLKAVELNVNKHNSACKAYEGLGMTILRSEENSIGHGFIMDDYVYTISVE